MKSYFFFIEHDVTRFIANKCLNPTTLLQTQKMLVLSQGVCRILLQFRHVHLLVFVYNRFLQLFCCPVYIYIKRAIATSVDSIIKNLTTTTKILIPYIEKLSKGKVSFFG